MKLTARLFLWFFLGLLLLKGLLGFGLTFWAAQAEEMPILLSWVNWSVIILSLISIPIVWNICFFFEFKAKKRFWLILWSLVFVQFPIKYLLEYNLSLDLGYKTYREFSNYPNYLYWAAPWYFYISLILSLYLIILAFWAARKNYQNPALIYHFKNSAKWVRRGMGQWSFIFTFALLSFFTMIYSNWGSRTEGFMTVSPLGVKSHITTYKKGKQKVVFIPTIHIADSSYYEDLLGKYASEHGVVLLEGITDHKESFKGEFNFRKIASSAGLQTQSDVILRHCDKDKVEKLENDRFSCGEKLEYLSSDLDFIDLDLKTKKYMEVIGREISEGKKLVEASRLALESIGGRGEFSIVLYDIFTNREVKLASSFVENKEKYPLIIIPWGALHAPAVNRLLKSNGYKKVSENSQEAMSFLTFTKVMSGR